jgi:hypothetical protein
MPTTPLTKPGNEPCSLADFIEILEHYHSSWLQGITLKDVPSIPALPWPAHTQLDIHPFSIPLPTQSVVLWRLTEEGDDYWRQKTFPIFDDDYYIFHIRRDLEWAGRGLELLHLYAVLTQRFGETSGHLDRYKSTFRFPFLLSLGLLEQTIHYLLIVEQYRSGVEFRFRRQHEGMEHLSREAYHEPFEKEFSREEMNRCVGFLLEYMALAFHTDPQAYIRNFHFTVPSNLIVYGCQEGRFYCRQAADFEEFDAHALAPDYWINQDQDGP